MHLFLRILLILTLFIASGCQEETTPAAKVPPQSAQSSFEKQAATPAPGQADVTDVVQTPEPSPEQPPQPAEQEPPRPPIFEDFQGSPQLSLFPRVGSFRPADDSDRLPYWNTFIEHLVKVTRVAEDKETGRRGWAFRSIKSIDSVGYFSPVAVEPQSSYEVRFTLSAELEEGASAGLGILEFNEFLWVAHQYTEETFNQHYRGIHEGKRLTETGTGEYTIHFTTGPETHMIHIVLFREGTHDRNSLMFDDIRIEQGEPGEG
jgi:hypothetical protein